MLKNKFFSNILFLATIAFIIRILISTFPSFEYDESAYRIWSARLVEKGPTQFYSTEFFTNNPLGGLYTFWFMGLLKSIFLPDLSFFSKNFDLLLKLPANIADIISALLIFTLIKKRLGQKWAMAGFLMYALNPALIFNSSVWGQYDGLSTLFLIISSFLISIKKVPEVAALSFATALVIKPQTIFFAPAFVFLVLLTTKPLKWFSSLLIFLITILVLYLPFFPTNPVYGLFYVNRNSADLFNCTTCFAFNFWGIFGNWQNDLQNFISIPLVFWGVMLLLATLVPILFLKPFALRFKPQYFYLTSAISIMAFFMLLTRMHERYLFPFFPFLLLATIMLKSRILIGFYAFISVVHLLNLYIPYAYYNNLAKVTNLPVNYLIDNFRIFSLMSFLCFILLLFYYFYAKQNSVS